MKVATLTGVEYRLSEYPKGRALFVLRGGKWNGVSKCYACPATPGNASALRMLGYTVDEMPAPVAAVIETVTKQSIRLPNASKYREYQRDGILRIDSLNGRVLLADEMGLGKTIQIIGWSTVRPDVRPCLVICPSCAKPNWKEELSKWLPNEKVMMVSGTKPPDDPWGEEPPAWVVINYEILFHWLVPLSQLGLKAIFIDEAHRIRNWYASGKRAKADPYGRKQTFNQCTDSTLKICKHVPHVVALTGSPLVSRPMDLFITLKLLRPDIFPSKFEFGMEYCNPTIDKWSGKVEYKGCTNPEKLNELLRKTVMIRRLKKDVLKDLPPKQRTVVPLELDNLEEYRETEVDMEMDALVKLGKLRQLVAQGKLNAAFAWVDNFLESGQKLVLFCYHRAIGQAIKERYGARCASYSGGMGETERWAAVKRFQEDPTCVLFNGSITACGLAITLTAASNVAVLELPWTPADLYQAEDRTHRIGQLYAVNVWLLISKDTVDEDLLGILIGKTGMADAVLDGGATQQQAMAAVLRSLRSRVFARTPAKTIKTLPPQTTG